MADADHGKAAAALGVPESTVSSRLTMAKDRFRRELGDAGLDPSLQVADEPTRYPAAAERSFSVTTRHPASSR